MRDPVVSALPIEEEIEVSTACLIQRRHVLLAGLAALCSLHSRADDGAGLSYDEFLARANPLAKRLVEDRSALGQDNYLSGIGALAAQLSSVPIPERWNASDQGALPDQVFIGFNPGGDPFRILHWRLEPGATVRPHAHTYGNVVTVCLEGSARVRNYEVLGEPDFETGDTFLVQQTIDQVLTPGTVNLVSLARNYIHGMTAGPDGARGLDITTRIKPKPEFSTPYLDLGKKPVDAFARVFEGAWESAASI